MVNMMCSEVRTKQREVCQNNANCFRRFECGQLNEVASIVFGAALYADTNVLSNCKVVITNAA